MGGSMLALWGLIGVGGAAIALLTLRSLREVRDAVREVVRIGRATAALASRVDRRARALERVPELRERVALLRSALGEAAATSAAIAAVFARRGMVGPERTR